MARRSPWPLNNAVCVKKNRRDMHCRLLNAGSRPEGRYFAGCAVSCSSGTNEVSSSHTSSRMRHCAGRRV
jgi:hypothetical protein